MTHRSVVAAVALIGVVLLAGCTSGTPAPQPVPVPSMSSSPSPTTGTDPAGIGTGQTSAGPILVDTTGRRLPAEAAAGVLRIFAALRTGATASLRDLYEPAPGAAQWATVATRLNVTANRKALIGALRNAPTPRPEVAWLYADGDYGLGITDRGRLAFVGVGQRAAAGPTPPGTFWVGSFLGHGRSLEVLPSGRGTYRFRTYDDCPPDTPGVPCEPDGPEQVAVVTLQVTRTGNAVTARVLTSNDEPEVPTGTVLPVTSSHPGVVTLGRGDDAAAFCADGAYDEICGA